MENVHDCAGLPSTATVIRPYNQRSTVQNRGRRFLDREKTPRLPGTGMCTGPRCLTYFSTVQQTERSRDPHGNGLECSTVAVNVTTRSGFILFIAAMFGPHRTQTSLSLSVLSHSIYFQAAVTTRSGFILGMEQSTT
jgi:hypothetical protein